jgi:hypothetical protein
MTVIEVLVESAGLQELQEQGLLMDLLDLLDLLVRWDLNN